MAHLPSAGKPRAILAAPSKEAESRQLTSPPPDGRKPLASACVSCRKRKCKCDGGRPTCAMCARRRRTKCEYDYSQNTLRGVQEANLQLKAKLARLQEMHAGTPDPSQEGASTGQSSAASASRTTSLASPLDASRESDADVASLLQRLQNDGLGVLSEPPTSPSGAVSVDSPSSEEVDIAVVLRFPPGKLTIFETAIDFFFKCAGDLFHLYTREQAQTLVEETIRNDDVHVKKTSLCQLCAIAAVASHYTKDPTLTQFRKRFYSLAKQYLTDLIIQSPMNAMKTCILLTMHDITVKNPAALSFSEIGLGLARVRGLDSKTRPQQYSPEEWLDLRSIWRTLVFLKCWIETTLGNDPNSSACITAGLESLHIDQDISMRSIIQREIAKISLLKANAFRAISSKQSSPLESARRLQAGLRPWYQKLPPWMHLNSLLDYGIEVEARRVLYLVHLTHLGALLLVQRFALTPFAQPDRINGEPVAPMPADAMEMVNGGFLAAKQSARVIGLLMDEQGVFQKCWLCIHQSYASCVVLLYQFAEGLAAGGATSNDVFENLSLAKNCLAALSWCAQEDEVAHHFHQLLSTYHDILSAAFVTIHGPQETMPVTTINPNDLEHVRSNTEATEELSRICRELVKLICRPFHLEMPKRSNSSMLLKRPVAAPMSVLHEVELGYHLDWTLEPEVGEGKDSGDGGIEPGNGVADDAQTSAGLQIG